MRISSHPESSPFTLTLGSLSGIAHMSDVAENPGQSINTFTLPHTEPDEYQDFLLARYVQSLHSD